MLLLQLVSLLLEVGALHFLLSALLTLSLVVLITAVAHCGYEFNLFLGPLCLLVVALTLLPQGFEPRLQQYQVFSPP